MLSYRCLPLSAALFVATAVAAGPAADHRSDPRASPSGGEQQHLVRQHQVHPSELLVKFRSGVPAARAEEIGKAGGAKEVRAFKKPRRLQKSAIDGWHVVKAGNGVSLDKLRAALLKNPNVEKVEYNYEIRLNLMPGDPSLGSLWGLNNTGQTGGAVDADIDAPEAWNLTTGDSNVIVAVIDTGIAYNHPDLTANIWTNPGEIPGNGIDDDGNGYIDDVHGYDFYSYDSDPFDDHGHGTHVSGTIAGAGNNDLGVAGVSWNSRLMGLKFLGASGSGSTSGAIGAILYAADMGANVMNNSWGGGGFSQALQDAITTADQVGAVFVAAAGNSGSNNDLTPNYPSNYPVPNVVAVAATNHYDDKASFSSFGASTVHLGAPGESIYSTVPTSGSSCCSNASGYMSLSGTSMATPHVSGAAALLFARFPGITNSQVKARLLAGVDSIAALNGKTITGGRLNALNSLEDDTTPPAAVSDLLVAGTGAFSVSLSLTATGDDGYSGVASSYVLRYSLQPIDESNFDQAALATSLPKPVASGSQQTVQVSGLQPASTYYFALKVVDNGGNLSGLSNVVTATTESVSLIFSDDMESGPGKWTIVGSNGVGGAALWHLSQHRAASPSNAFYYGQEGSLNFDTGAANYGSITSGAISLDAVKGSQLSFKHFLQTEGSTYYDKAKVEVSADGGMTWSQVYSSIGTNGQMQTTTLDLSAYDNQVIRLRFSFDTVDSVANAYEGWVVDDVQIYGSLENDTTPPAPVVDLAASAFDSSSISLNWTATADDAYSGGPAASYDLRYSTSPIDAANFNAATPASSVPQPGPLGTIESFKLAGLNPGTTYYAALKVIDNMGNASEISNVISVKTRSGIFGTAFFDDVESGAGNWTFAGSDGVGGGPLWHVSTHRAGSPSSAFYYGKSDTLDFNTGARNYGTLTSPAIDLTNVEAAKLTFNHFLATENLAPYDAARVQASDDGGLSWKDLYVTSIGTSGGMPKHEIDLASFQSKVIFLRFSFDTVDSAFNSFEGWVVDDIVVTGWGSTVQDLPPVAVVGGPYSAMVGQPITFDAGKSYDPEGQALSFSWNFGDGSTGAGIQPVHAYAAKGSYQVVLTASDGVASASATTTVTVANQPPLASAGGPYKADKNKPVVLNGGLSFDPDGDTLTYTWSFGDGSTGTGVAPSHTYAASGFYIVTLSVSDGQASSTASTTVEVANQAPVASAGGPYGAEKNKPVVLNGGLSTDPDGDVLTYAWSFGDGSTGTGATPSHIYATSGTYTVTLTVSDGEASGTATTTVTVLNQAPLANAGGPYTADKNKPVVLNGAQSSDANGDTLTYAWSFGDGSTGTGATPSHTYATSGTYTAMLTVSDGEASATAATSVTVANQAPLAVFSAPSQVLSGEVASFDASASNDANGDVLTYRWNLGGSTVTSNSPLASKAFAVPGTYSVDLIVSDGEADSSPVSHTVTVLNRPPMADAGPDQTVVQRTVVSLSGAGSADPDGVVASFAWRQISGPAVSLASTNGAATSFTTPNVGGTTSVVLTFELTVTDGLGATAVDQVVVTVVKKL